MSIHARISTIQGDAGTIDDAVKFINEKIMLVLHGVRGSMANFLADRSAGKPVAVASMPTKPRSKEASKRMTLSERGSRLDGTGADGSDQVRTDPRTGRQQPMATRPRTWTLATRWTGDLRTGNLTRNTANEGGVEDDG